MSLFAESFEDAAKQSEEHAMQMFKQGDKAHLDAAEKMKAPMPSQLKMDNWLQDRSYYFNNLVSEHRLNVLVLMALVITLATQLGPLMA